MKIEWRVPKMKCDGCVKTIAETLLLLEGVNNVQVDLDKKSVYFETENKQTIDLAKKSLNKTGFPPEEL